MNRGNAPQNRHRVATILRGIALLGIPLLLVFCAEGCGIVSPLFPAGFIHIASRLDAWENQREGFRLVLVSTSDRFQGFLEWGAQNLYGRIVEAKVEGNTHTFSLGDGGTGGIEVTAVTQGASILVRYRVPARVDSESQGGQEEVTISATRLKAAEALVVLASRHKEMQNDGHGASLRLQYLSARQTSQARMFDEVLRRGRTPYQMASFRRTQQKDASSDFNVSPVPPGTPQLYGAAHSEQSQSPVPLFEYEEIEYPIFISDRFVSIATQRYLFSGGAHGAASTDFDVIDRKAGRRLGPSDIFIGEEWKVALPSLLKAELLRQSGFRNVRGNTVANAEDSSARASAGAKNQSQTDLRTLGFFEPDIKPSENVFVCGSGLGFEYDRYQIAPWSMGEFILVLPWSEVKPYVNPALLSAIQPQ